MKCVRNPQNVILKCFLASTALASGVAQAQWYAGGSDLNNSRNAFFSTINAGNVKKLHTKWTFPTHGDVSATPTVADGTVYAVDWGGYLYSVDATSGKANWSHALNDYTGNPGNLTSVNGLPIVSLSRTSPAVDFDRVIIGDQGYTDSLGTGTFQLAPGTGTASVMAVSRADGHLLWRTTVETHWEAAITSSPVVFGGRVYVGVCSLEEGVGEAPFPYEFTFKGSVACLDELTGKILWQTKTITNNATDKSGQGYAGGSVWGSTPVVDLLRGSLYVGTGNNYAVPAGSPEQSTSTLTPGNNIDSIMALDLFTGKVKWTTSPRRVADTWNAGNLFGGVNSIKINAGPDYDFGSGPNLYWTARGGFPVQLLGAGEKSGQYWALNPDNGQIVWNTQVGPGGTAGGIEWGSAVDGARVYCAVSNSNDVSYTGLDGQTHSAGLWGALDASTGKYLWQIPDPKNGEDLGMVSVANDVVFVGSMSGDMYAINSNNGKIVWDFQATNSSTNGPASVNAGPAVVGDSVYWGSGYSHFFFGSPGNTLYAFTIN